MEPPTHVFKHVGLMGAALKPESRGSMKLDLNLTRLTD